MDQIEIDEAVEQLVSELKQMGLACPKNKARKMIRHLELVIEKNKVMNLTRIVTLRDAVTLHIVDSLVPLLTKDFVPSEGLRFVDIGTGAGFPGIPLAIMTNMQGTLIDSVERRSQLSTSLFTSLILSHVVHWQFVLSFLLLMSHVRLILFVLVLLPRVMSLLSMRLLS